MEAFKICGGRFMQGEITPQGAKNEALQVICAALLTKAPVVLHNVPEVSDVHDLLKLIGLLGVISTPICKGSYQLNAAHLSLNAITTQNFQILFGKIRGSIMILGPLLARIGEIQFYKPGGDRIGRRGLYTHLTGLNKLGVVFTYNEKEGSYVGKVKDKLKGSYVLLDEASVTGTANVIMAASLAIGNTTIYNAACEVYIQQLCEMLVRMGSVIKGIGSNLLMIEGKEALGGVSHTILPDILEVGSFIGLAAATMSDITIKNVPTQLFIPISENFKKLGVQLEIDKTFIRIPPQHHYEIKYDNNRSLLTLSDAIWPGFPPDLISIAIVTAIHANGTILIHQKMYENRLFFIDQLIEMGARLILCDPHRVSVTGLNRRYPLRGIKMVSGDIRAGIALLIAALAAEGVSSIENIQQIDRGYERIDERLNKLGASIERIY